MPDQTAWKVLKSRGQTVNVNQYESGYIMNKFNWKNLYNNTTDPAEKQVIRYILTMLALNPPYKNRSTGNRNKITNNTIAYMENNAFNNYLSKIKPVNNQGTGLRKAFLRTAASGARKAVKGVQPFVLPLSGAALVAAFTPGLGISMALPAAQKALQGILIDRTRAYLKNKMKGVPFSNQIVNKAMSYAGGKFSRLGPSANDNDARNVIESSVENAFIDNEMKKWANAGMPVTNRQAFAASIRNGSYKNKLKPNQAKAAFKKATANGFKGMAVGSLLGAGATVGALAAGGASAAKGVVNVGKLAGTGQRQAANASMRILERTGKLPGKVVKNVAKTASKVSGFNVKKAELEFVRKMLNRAAAGEIIPANMINKAVRRAGSNQRVAFALEKGGSFAKNLLLSSFSGK